MAELNFEYYKQQMREYFMHQQYNHSAPELDLNQIIDGMRVTFPKKPAQTDRLAICYGYWYRSQLPMEPDYKKDWRKQIKSYINTCSDKQPNDDALHFLLLNLEKTADFTPKNETFNYADKAIKKMSKSKQNQSEIKEILGRLARPYYDELLDEAKSLSLDSTKYLNCIKAFDKATNVLLKIPHTVRYKQSLELIRLMQPVYMQTEWGQREFPRRCASIRRRVYKSMPANIKQAMRSANSRNNYNCK